MRRPLLALAFVSAALAAPAARAGGRKGHVRFDAAYAGFPSAKYAALTADGCRAELRARGVAFVDVPRAPGVLAPVRLPRGAGGVLFRTEAPDHVRAHSPYDVFDCRLALALDDFAKVLSRHDIDEVRMFSAWRPDRGARADHAPETRHPGGLAMDAARFGKRLAPGETERRWLDVEKDFHGAIGAPVCGAGAAPPSPATPEARELRSIACEAVDLHLFTVVLTPNYNRAHRNHLHLEVTPGVSWSLVR